MFKRFVLLTLAFLVLCGYFIWERGYLRALVSPEAFVAVLLTTYFALSAKYGFKQTARGIFFGPQGAFFFRDALLIANLVGGVLLIFGVFLTVNRLAEGYEVVVSVATHAVLPMLYSLLLSLYLVITAKS